MFSILISSLFFIHQLMSAAAQISVIMELHILFYNLIQKIKNEMISMRQGKNDINLPRSYFLVFSILCYSAVAWPLSLNILILSGIGFNIFSIVYTSIKLGQLSKKKQDFFNQKWMNLSYIYFGLASILYIIGLFVFPANITAILPGLIFSIIGLDPLFWLTGLQFGVIAALMHSIFSLLKAKVEWFSNLNSRIEPYLAEFSKYLHKFLMLFSILNLPMPMKILLLFVYIYPKKLFRYAAPYMKDFLKPLDSHTTFECIRLQNTLQNNTSSCVLDTLSPNEKNGRTLINLQEINSSTFEKKITAIVSVSPYQSILSTAFISSGLMTEQDIHDNKETLALALLNSAFKKLSTIDEDFQKKHGSKEDLKAKIGFQDLMDATNALKSKIKDEKKEEHILLMRAFRWAERAAASEKSNIQALPRSTSLHLIYAGVLIAGLNAMPTETTQAKSTDEKILEILNSSSWDICPERTIQDFEELLYNGMDSLEVMVLQHLKELYLFITPEEQNKVCAKSAFLSKPINDYILNDAEEGADSLGKTLYNFLLALGFVEGLDVHAHNHATNYSALNFNLIDGSRADNFEKDIKDNVLALNFIGMYHSKDMATLNQFDPIVLSSAIFTRLLAPNLVKASDSVEKSNGTVNNYIKGAHILESTYLLAFRNTLSSLLQRRNDDLISSELDKSATAFIEKTSIEVDAFANLLIEKTKYTTNIEDNLKALISKFGNYTDLRLGEAPKAIAPFNFYLISPDVIKQQLQETKDLKAQMELMCTLIGQELILQHLVAKRVLSVFGLKKAEETPEEKAEEIPKEKAEETPEEKAEEYLTLSVLGIGIFFPPKKDEISFISKLIKRNGI